MSGHSIFIKILCTCVREDSNNQCHRPVHTFQLNDCLSVQYVCNLRSRIIPELIITQIINSYKFYCNRFINWSHFHCLQRFWSYFHSLQSFTQFPIISTSPLYFTFVILYIDSMKWKRSNIHQLHKTEEATTHNCIQHVTRFSHNSSPVGWGSLNCPQSGRLQYTYRIRWNIGGEFILADCSEYRQYKIRQQKLHAARATPLCSYCAPKHARGCSSWRCYATSAAPFLSVEDQTR